MFGFLKRRRRARVLARHSIPDDLWRRVVSSTPALARLDDGARSRLRDLTLLFLHEKRFDAARGLALTDAMRVKIAALACRLVLELGLDCYSGFHSVIVYPGEFLVRDREHIDDAGVVHVGDETLSGEAWELGPVVLSWADVEQSGQGDGYDVVAHEFAHKLDGLDGATNGMPPLHRGMSPRVWSETFSRALLAASGLRNLCARPPPITVHSSMRSPPNTAPFALTTSTTTKPALVLRMLSTWMWPSSPSGITTSRTRASLCSTSKRRSRGPY